MNWTCPYCNRPQMASSKNYGILRGAIYLSDARDSFYGVVFALRCLNNDCQKTSLDFDIFTYVSDGKGNSDAGEKIQDWKLWPASNSKPQPDYIPAPLRQDYEEACVIRDLSPKASATLARRCLQGMIRDFCGIRRGNLDAEIKELRRVVEAGEAPAGVTPETVEGIDHVRSIGNIGAHMEKDIDLIIDIEPDEAQILIGLVETLFEEWYVAQHNRTNKLAALKAIAERKRTLIEEGRAARAEQKALPPPDA